MRGGEEPRSRADTGKEQSLTFEIAHDLGIGERSCVDRKFPVGMRRWWRDDSTSLLGGRKPFLCLVLNLAFIGQREFGIRQGNARKGSVPFVNDGHFSECDSQEIA